MTENVTARKKTQKPQPKRARAAPVQVYLSASELADLRELARTQHMSVSDLVRRWIARATAATRGARNRERPPPADPRQLDVSELYG